MQVWDIASFLLNDLAHLLLQKMAYLFPLYSCYFPQIQMNYHETCSTSVFPGFCSPSFNPGQLCIPQQHVT